MQRHADLFLKDVAPALAGAGIGSCAGTTSADEDARRLREYFRDRSPGAHPAGGRPGAPVPLHFRPLAQPRRHVRVPDGAPTHFARVKVPNNLPRFVQVGPAAETATFLPLEDLIAAHLPQLFPGMEIVSHHLFRVTRNADLEVEEDRDEDLLQALERELARRRFGPAVRLEVTETMDPQILEVLLSEMEMSRTTSSRCPACSTCRRCGPSTTSTGPSSRTSRSSRRPTRGSRRRDPEERLRHPARGRRAGAPPLPLVRHERAALHRAGRRRPERAGHQADALPHRPATPPSSTRSSRPPRPASRSSSWWRSRPASTRRPTSAGPARWSAPAATSSTGWSG